MKRKASPKKSDREKTNKFERGEDVPLDELPKELQKNVKDPPPSVQKLKKKLEKKSSSLKRRTEKSLPYF